MGASNPIELAAEIIAAFVSSNPLPKGELPSLIRAVHVAVANLAAGPEHAQPQIEVKEPAVPTTSNRWAITRSRVPSRLVISEERSHV